MNALVDAVAILSPCQRIVLSVNWCESAPRKHGSCGLCRQQDVVLLQLVFMTVTEYASVVLDL